MRALPFLLIGLLVMSAPAYALNLSEVFRPLEDFFEKLNRLVYGSVQDEITVYALDNYEVYEGVYVDKLLYELLTVGNISTASYDASDFDRQLLEEDLADGRFGIIIQFNKLPSVDTIYQIAEALGGEVFHIDRGINAVAIRLVDQPRLKAWIAQNASELHVAAVYIDPPVSTPEKPPRKFGSFDVGRPVAEPKPDEQPERPIDNATRTNNTIDRPEFRPWVGNPHPIVEKKRPQVKNETPVREVEIGREQVERSAWTATLTKANEVWEENVTGRSVVIAILDTGIDESHPMLANATIGCKSFVEGEDCHDYHGHGTHVAGIAAGRPVLAEKDGRQVWVSGIAPNARILNIKVLGKNGGGSMSGVIAGLDYVAEWKSKHPDTPVVVSMSLGTPFGNPHDPVSQKVNWLADQGIPVVVAAGNEFVVIDSPGLAESAITVAAVNEEGKVASFSGKGPGTNYKDIKPDIAAPGVKVPSARANTKQLVEMSGTSMATPAVAGTIALVLERNPDLADKPGRVKELLEATAESTGEPEIWVGAGIVDAYAAVEKLPKRQQFGIMAKIKGLFGS